ncbi:MAG TPA: hypothetical protein EYO20_08470 [Gemmatimonadetes bacterium]|jgi:uncharacterized protein YndB with AHSA1/START domain|nr:hypothetical protein [Gemmatimonadota bacterium]
MRSPFGPGVTILGTGAVILILFLFVGILLPGTWSAEASALLPASPEATFRYLDSPSGWSRWTIWPDSGVQTIGPQRGEGSGFTWDDPELGTGVFTIVEIHPPKSIRYHVEMQGGGMRIDGEIELSLEEGDTRVLWRESGNLGANPLMGYWALSMDRVQTSELEKSLDRLVQLVENPTDFIDSEPSR